VIHFFVNLFIILAEDFDTVLQTGDFSFIILLLHLEFFALCLKRRHLGVVFLLAILKDSPFELPGH
jgi:hypothetical protein